MKIELLLLTAVLTAGPGIMAAETTTARLSRNDLLLWRNEANVIQPVRSPADWQHRRAEILRGMQAVMGPLPGPERRCALEIRVEEEVDCGGYVRRLISYQAEPGSRVPAYLCIPKPALAGGRKTPGVLCLHGTNDKIGHGTVIEGIGTNANRHYATELAKRGYVTIAPNYPLLASYQPDLKALGYASGTMKAIWDNLRALDVLESLPFVSRGGFGAIGHSLGGHNSIYTAVFDQRIQAVVSSCGLDSYLDYYGGNPSVWKPEKGWCQTRYMPRLAGYAGRLEEIPFDFHELIGALAPRHVLISAPLRDSNFKWESVDRVAAAASAVYKLYGRAERLQVIHPDSPHDFTDEARQQAYALFDSVLR